MLGKIFSNRPHVEDLNDPNLSPEKEESALLLLDQPYYYLKSGGQGYSFISKDKKTVLKFFKNHHMRDIPWLHSVQLPGVLDIPRQRTLNWRQRKYDHVHGSCKIAVQKMQEETGLVYCHFNQTSHLNKKVVIYDKIGIRHTVDLDKVEFVLQKKVDLVFSKFHDLMEKNDIQSARSCIDSMLNLFVSRYQKGIDDHDPIVRKNFGYDGTKAIEIDLGSFFENEALKDPSIYKRVLQREMTDFSEWITEFYPSLSPYLQEKLQELTLESPLCSCCPS